MRRSCFPLLVWCALVAACGGKDEGPPPPPTQVVVTITDASSDAAVGDAVVMLLTDGAPGTAARSDEAGRVTFEATPGSYTLRVEAASYITHPGVGPGAVTVTAAANKDTPVGVALEPRPGSTPGGTMTGRVTRGGQGVPNALVVASATAEFSALTDGDGRFTMVGVAGGMYGVSALATKSASNRVTSIQVTAGETTADVDLELTDVAGVTVDGTLGPGSGRTEIYLVSAGTKERIPGLSVTADFGGGWAIEGVPDGRYDLHVAEEIDGKVLNPDLLRRKELPLDFVVMGMSRTFDLETADTVTLVSPVGTSSVSNVPQLEWRSYSGADFYVVEVTDILGQVIWGGFDARQNPTLRVLPPQTSVRYGDLNTPLQPTLTEGRWYRWRVYAGMNTTTGTLFELIGASEAAEGAFRVAR